MKAQWVRALDFGLLGPALMLAATQKRLTPAWRLLLLSAGAGTIVYNWQNWRLRAVR
jgi:hypothetical protein